MAGIAIDSKKPEKMVRFSFFKEAMDVQTNKAQLIKLGPVKNPIKVWLPKSKIKVEDDTERGDGYNLVTMPLWLYERTELPNFTDPEILEA